MKTLGHAGGVQFDCLHLGKIHAGEFAERNTQRAKGVSTQCLREIIDDLITIAFNIYIGSMPDRLGA